MKKLILLSTAILCCVVQVFSQTCPTDPHCAATFTAYSFNTASCGAQDYGCDNLYSGDYGKIRIPVLVRRMGSQNSSTSTQFNQILASTNQFLSDHPDGVPIEFYVDGYSLQNSSSYDDALGPAAQAYLQGLQTSNPNRFIVNVGGGITADTASANGDILGLASYPYLDVNTTIEDSRILFIQDSVVTNNAFTILAHELGHMLGLFHTFDSIAFPIGTSCASFCREGDGISDTDEYAATGLPDNFMEYDEDFVGVPYSPNITITPCQSAKMLRVLYEGRNNLGLALTAPTVVNKSGTTLGSSTTRTVFYNELLDTLLITLEGSHKTFTEDFAQFLIKDYQGDTIYTAYHDSLNLNDLYATILDEPGTYTLEIRDKRPYGTAESSSRTMTLALLPCNLNGICDPWETATSCPDCSTPGIPALLTTLEYFIDTDPGRGLGTHVALGNVSEVDMTINIPLSGVTPGIHTLYVRAKDDQGRWGFTQRRVFMVHQGGNGPRQLTRLEYFVDTDPGRGNGTALSLTGATTSDSIYTLDLAGVSPGIHTLYVRAKDDAGAWSFTQRRVFMVSNVGGSSRQLDRLEYFIDEDPGRGLGTSLPLTDAVNSDSTYTLDLTNVDPGIHTLYVRARDNAGTWSFVQRRVFMVTSGSGTSRELSYLEYFIDSDPGRGQGTSLPLAGAVTSDSTYNIDLTNITPGIHTLYVRAKDNANAWSFTQRRVFMVTPGDNTPAEVEYLEYWVSGAPDPGRGNATEIPITTGPDVDVTENIPVPSTNQNYTVFVRAKDTKGRWSFVVSDTLYWSGNEIAVTSPSNNPNWIAGQSNITYVNWDTTGNVGNVDIYLVTASGNEVLAIDSNEDPEGPWSGSVAIPIWVNAGNYRIRVRDRVRNGIVGYSNVFSINSPATSWCQEFTDLNLNFGNAAELAAATCLCTEGYVLPQNYGPTNTYGVEPDRDIFRADLAKLVWYALNGTNATSIAELFPTPFADLQQSNNSYYRFAKALSYLEYDDGVSAFDRDFINFRPYDKLQVRYAIKALLEAFDIAPDNSGSGTIFGLVPGEDGYGHINKAQQLGLLSGFSGSATDDMRRGTMFIALYELLDVCNGNEVVAAPATTDYFLPGQFTPYNLNRGVGVSDGYFRSHTSTSFAIPGRGLALSFGHTYNSYLSELPREYRLLEPLGRGWSHTYDSYILFEEGWSFDNLSKEDEYVVSLPGGSFHVFDATTYAARTAGSRHRLRRTGPQTLVLTMPDHVEYTYTKYVLPQGYEVYMLDGINDRNGNALDIVLETVSWQAPGEPSPGSYPRIKEVEDDFGRKLIFGYANSTAGPLRLTGVSDPTGVRAVSYSPFGKTLGSYTNALSETTQYGYGASGSTSDRFCLLETIVLPKGNTITNAYDAQRKLASVTLPNQSTPSVNVGITPNYASTTQKYETVVTTPSNTTTNEYTDGGYLSASTTNSKTRSYLYGSSNYPNQPTRSTYEGRSVNYSYDGQGRVTTITLPEGIVHQFQYNSRNDVTRYTDPRNSITQFQYDANGNLDRVQDPLGGITYLQYDGNKQLAQVRNPSMLLTTYAYHPTGPLQTADGQLGRIYTQDIDAIGRVTERTDGNGNSTSLTYDELDRVIQNAREGNVPGDEIVTSYDFDANGNLTQVTNALNGATTMGYDDRDLLTSVDFGDDGSEYEYLDNGQLDTEETPNNVTFQQVYDALDRLTDDGYATYTYDNFNRVATTTRGSDVLTYSYDDADRVTAIDYNGESVTYTYDASGNTKTVSYSGFTTTYDYDVLNRLTRVRWTGGTGAQGVSYTYHADGRMKSATNPNGTKREYYYDVAGRLSELVEHAPATTDTIAYFTYQYDNNDNIGVETSEGRYLSPAIYTAASDTYSYNGENEIATASTGSFAFDNNGNQTSSPDGAATWDTRDRLLSYRGATYTYDPTGKRRSVSDGATSRDYILDARGMGHVLAERENGTLKYRYVQGAGLTLRIDVANGNVEHFYHFDYRGSTVAMTDDTLGITHAYSYLPYGEQVREVELDDQPFTYVGRYGVMDEGDDLYYMRARYYEAESGRFMSEDPVWHENLYPYADGNPVTMVDPNGGNATFVESLKSDFALFRRGFRAVPRAYNEGMELSIQYAEEAREHYASLLEDHYSKPKSEQSAFALKAIQAGYVLSDAWAYDLTRDVIMASGSIGSGKYVTKVVGKTGALKLYDMRTTAGRAIKYVTAWAIGTGTEEAKTKGVEVIRARYGDEAASALEDIFTTIDFVTGL